MKITTNDPLHPDWLEKTLAGLPRPAVIASLTLDELLALVAFEMENLPVLGSRDSVQGHGGR